MSASPVTTARLLSIGRRTIGPGRPCLIIAEAGVNHDGDVARGHALIDAAKATGADVVKFQAFRTDDIATPGTAKADYQVETTGQDGGQVAMLRALELTADEHTELKRHCDEIGISYMCTPYDRWSVDLLDEMDVDAFKIASTDSTNTPFLRYVACKGRPVILSSGMTSIEELDLAVSTLGEGGLDGRLAVLHCTSAYPAPPAESNLRVLQTLAARYELPVGFSDHTRGVDVAVLAVAGGACIVEKHFTLDKSSRGPDHRASLEPSEFTLLVERIREAERILGDGVKTISDAERSNKIALQKSLVACHPIAAGSVIREDDLAAKRPATGLPPSSLDDVVGRTALVDIEPDSPISMEMLSEKSSTEPT